MQFYLILPFLLIFVPKRILLALLLVIALGLFVLSSYWLADGQRQSVYFSLLARVPEFVIGSMLATVPFALRSEALKNVLAVIGLGMVVASFLLISENTPFPGVNALPGCIGTALLIAARGSQISRGLSFAPMVWCGNLSYSIYLWHWPTLAAVRYVLEDYRLPITVLLPALSATLALSYLSWRFVEVPFRRGRRTKGTFARVFGLAFVLILMLSAAVRLADELADPLPKELGRYADADEICHGKVLSDCLRGNTASNVTVLLIGDSHAAQLNHWADIVGEKLGVRFEVVSASSCVPIDGFDVARIADFAHAACASQTEEINRRINHADAVIMAGKWVYHMPSETFAKAMIGFFENMQKQKIPLLVLAQIPMLEGDIRRARRFARLGFPNELERADSWQKSNSDLRNLSDNYDMVTFLDLSDAELFSDAPFYGEEIIYFDRHHINERGSNLYGVTAAAPVAEWLKQLKVLPEGL